jgi:hypothetical protein
MSSGSINRETKMNIEKVWVNSIFGCYKGIVIERKGKNAKVQLVGYPFGSYPNGKELDIPTERLSERGQK